MPEKCQSKSSFYLAFEMILKRATYLLHNFEAANGLQQAFS